MRLTRVLVLRAIFAIAPIYANQPNYSVPDMNISNLNTVGTISGVGASSELDQSGALFFRAGFRIEC